MLLRYTLFAVFVVLGFSPLAANTFAPTAVCTGQVYVAVDANCVGSISTSMIDAGSSSPWGPVYLSLDQTEFYPGTHEVTLTVQDAFGSNRCFAQVIVEDKTPPELACTTGVDVETYTPWDIEGAYDSADLIALITDNCGSFSYSVSVQAGTDYGPRSFTVSAVDDAGNTANCYGTINILLPTLPTGYCNSYGNAGYEYIRSMKISTPYGVELDLASGNNSGAAYFPAFPVTLVEGSDVDFTYRPGFVGSVYAEYWRFYLDLNRDGDFDDAGELLFYDKQNRDETRNWSITLPATFQSYGPTRMRVVMAWNGYRGPCETGFWGEREDYLVNLEENTTGARFSATTITSKSAHINTAGNEAFNVSHPVAGRDQLPLRAPGAEEVSVWPNPAIAGAVLNVEVPESMDVRTIIVREALGQTVAEVSVTAGRNLKSITLPAALAPGVYLLSGADAKREVRWTKRLVVR